MKLEFNNLANFELDLKYHGWGMPLTVDVLVNCMHMYYGAITEDKKIEGSFFFDRDTPFRLEINLRDKTYAHTDLDKNLDHCIEIVKLKFMDYDLLPLMHENVYYAHQDCEQPNPGDMVVTHGSKVMGQNGTLMLGSIKEPFFTWYHKITHQGVLYELT